MKIWAEGGCLCGAIRYQLLCEAHAKHICHCSLCQKYTGSDKALFVEVKRQNFHIIQGEMSIYKSSSIAERGFCKTCASPLTYDCYDDNISIHMGSLDKPEKYKEIETEFIHHKEDALF